MSDKDAGPDFGHLRRQWLQGPTGSQLPLAVAAKDCVSLEDHYREIILRLHPNLPVHTHHNEGAFKDYQAVFSRIIAVCLHAEAARRTPFMVTSKVGMSKSETRNPRTLRSLNLSSESNDPEYDEWQRHFSMIETSTDKLIKDTKAFMDAVNGV